MFIGEYRHNLDDKGRLQIPAKWRTRLAEGAVLTKGFDGSLAFYPLPVWQEMAAKLAKLPQSQPSARAYVRQVLAGAVDVEMDKLGRINLPPMLREYAKLKKAAVLTGLYDHVELWNDKDWDKYQGDIDPNSEETAQVLKEIGL